MHTALVAFSIVAALTLLAGGIESNESYKLQTKLSPFCVDHFSHCCGCYFTYINLNENFFHKSHLLVLVFQCGWSPDILSPRSTALQVHSNPEW